MKQSEYLIKSFLNAAGVVIYTALIAGLLSNGENIFGPAKSFLIPLFMLLLFIISASITSFLVLGKPVLLYLNGHKKEALTLLFATLTWLVIFVSVLLLTLLSI